MRSILFLTDNLRYHGQVRQLTLLAPALPADRFRTEIFSLRGPGPLAAELRVGGQRSRLAAPVENLYELRKSLASRRPDLLHVWGLPALRSLWWLTLLKRSLVPPLVISVHASQLKQQRLQFLDRQMLSRVRVFAVDDESQRDAFANAGVPLERLRIVRPGVAIPEVSDAAGRFRAESGITRDDCLFLSVGHFESPYRSLDTLWAFEIVRGIEPAMNLILIGDGPYRQRVANIYYYASQPGNGVQFHAPRPDAAQMLTQADAVITGHRRSGGTYAVLEGMAAGKPVIATQLPHLQALIQNGETGFLVPSGKPPGISRVTLQLIREPALRLRIGEAGRAYVERHHRVDAMADAFAGIYDDVLLA